MKECLERKEKQIREAIQQIPTKLWLEVMKFTDCFQMGFGLPCSDCVRINEVSFCLFFYLLCEAIALDISLFALSRSFTGAKVFLWCGVAPY